MKWLSDIETELQRLPLNENPGRTRAIARRIAGIALKELYKLSSEDFVQLLQRAADDSTLPEEIRASSTRLSARLSSDFTSPSTDPIGDAQVIVEFVKKQK